MSKIVLVISVFGLFFALQTSLAQEAYKDASAPVEERVGDLISRMTIEEKIGQLCYPTGWEMYEKIDDQTVVPSDIFKERMQSMPLGGFWATLRADPWTQ